MPVLERGLDYSFARPSVSGMWSAGYRFVSRYLSWLPNNKVINASELRALRAQGFTVFLNWEFTAKDALGGASAGKSHATEAVRQAKALGYPAGCTIYFSVDFDQQAGQVSACHAYLSAATAVLHASGYRSGVYGGYNAVKRALDAKVVDDAWQAYAWSGGRWDSRAALRQVKNGVSVGGGDCDLNERWGVAYGYGSGVSAPVPAPAPAADNSPGEDDYSMGVQLEVGKAVSFANPTNGSGRKTWLELTSDLGDAVVRVALKHKGAGWEIHEDVAVTSAGDDVAILLDGTVRKVSVLLKSVSAPNTAVGLDLFVSTAAA